MGVEQLTQAREHAGLSLEDVARKTGIKVRTLASVERGEFAELPAGLYCRSSIRSFATTVGVDADALLAELAPLLPRPEDPLDGMARLHGLARRAAAIRPDPVPAPPATTPPAAMPAAPAVAAAVTPALTIPDPVPADVSIAGELILSSDGRSPLSRPAPSTHRLGLGDDMAGRLRPLAASVFDAGLLAGIDVALVWLTARVCGISMASAMKLGGPGMALVFLLIAALYFVLLGGVRNATFGARLFDLPNLEQDRDVLDVRAVLERARRCFVRETAIFVDPFQRGGGERWFRVVRPRRADV